RCRQRSQRGATPVAEKQSPGPARERDRAARGRRLNGRDEAAVAEAEEARGEGVLLRPVIRRGEPAVSRVAGGARQITAVIRERADCSREGGEGEIAA